MPNESLMLFEGAPTYDGLTNAKRLAAHCPEEFRQPNRWSEFAEKLFEHLGSTAHWRFKTSDESARSRQMRAFSALTYTVRGISYGEKIAIGGWMLAEMLEEIPEYRPH